MRISEAFVYILQSVGKYPTESVLTQLQDFGLLNEDLSESFEGVVDFHLITECIQANQMLIDDLVVLLNDFHARGLRYVVDENISQAETSEEFVQPSTFTQRILLRKENIKNISTILNIQVNNVKATQRWVNFGGDLNTCLLRLKNFVVDGECMNCIRSVVDEQTLLKDLIRGSQKLVQKLRDCEVKIADYERVVADYQRR